MVFKLHFTIKIVRFEVKLVTKEFFEFVDIELCDIELNTTLNSMQNEVQCNVELVST